MSLCMISSTSVPFRFDQLGNCRPGRGAVKVTNKVYNCCQLIGRFANPGVVVIVHELPANAKIAFVRTGRTRLGDELARIALQ